MLSFRSSLICLTFILPTALHAGERNVRGKVVDEAGKPVADATVSQFWTGNGKGTRDDGTPLDLKEVEDRRLFRSHLGEMQPLDVIDAVKTDSTGAFHLKIGDQQHSLIGMDRARKRGALLALPKGKEEEAIEIRLGPLVKVHGIIECAQTGKPPFWGVADVFVLDDPARPLDNGRIAICVSFDGCFEMSFPPGRYMLEAYGNLAEQDNNNVRAIQAAMLNLAADKPDVDLGTLRLAPYLRPRQRVEQAKANGTCFDYKKHYGEAPPAWHITDTRGVSKDVKISDFNGKWVLLTFWGMNCTVCLGDELPRLMKFYEEHKAQRDQFEILSICIDYDGDLKTLADVDHALEPIVKNVWGGKTLPFPVLLDPSFKTWETFGIDGLGTTILIDPEGKLVEGDETTLAEKLK